MTSPKLLFVGAVAVASALCACRTSPTAPIVLKMGTVADSRPRTLAFEPFEIRSVDKNITGVELKLFDDRNGDQQLQPDEYVSTVFAAQLANPTSRLQGGTFQIEGSFKNPTIQTTVSTTEGSVVLPNVPVED
jgi:hypothetical protein